MRARVQVEAREAGQLGAVEVLLGVVGARLEHDHVETGLRRARAAAVPPPAPEPTTTTSQSRSVSRVISSGSIACGGGFSGGPSGPG